MMWLIYITVIADHSSDVLLPSQKRRRIGVVYMNSEFGMCFELNVLFYAIQPSYLGPLTFIIWLYIVI